LAQVEYEDCNNYCRDRSSLQLTMSSSPVLVRSGDDQEAEAKRRLREKFGGQPLPGVGSMAAATSDTVDGLPDSATSCVISCKAYYGTWNGHTVDHLAIAHAKLRNYHRNLIFLAGDSSLDNKGWFQNEAPALNGYEEFLQPPRMRTDVCYWLNHEAVQRGASQVACLNTAVEATTLSNRAGKLLPADQFVRDHITAEDYLVVSIGGNDVALKPSGCTIVNMLLLVRCTSQRSLRHCTCGCLPFAACCGGSATHLGCGGCFRSLFGCVWPPCLGYFVDLFGNCIKNYVLRLLGATRPQKVVICMIYFLDELGSSWADKALAALDYDENPGRLKEAIRAIFRLATRRICIPGTQVVAFPLFKVLDGTCSVDYVSRVEPSASGGQKLGSAVMKVLLADGNE